MKAEYKLLNQFIDWLYQEITIINIAKANCCDAIDYLELHSLYCLTLRVVNDIKTIDTSQLERGSLQVRQLLSRERSDSTPLTKPFLDRFFHEFCKIDAEICRRQRESKAAHPSSTKSAESNNSMTHTKMPNDPKPFCRGKKKLRTKLDAKIALASTQFKRRRTYYAESRYYFCATCDAWHLTSQPRRSPPASERDLDK